MLTKARFFNSQLFRRTLSTNQNCNSHEPISLETFVWLPAVKKRNSIRAVVEREVLSTKEAKRRFASENHRGVDPWGHAAAKITVNGSHPSIDPELIATLQEIACDSGVEFSTAKTINSLQAYISWYPADKLEDSFSEIENIEWMKNISSGDADVDSGKKASLELFKQKHTAFNQNQQADLLGYGKPDSTVNFSRGLNFKNVVKACFLLMKPEIKDNLVVMNQTLPNATYYGRAMLNEHRLSLKLLTEIFDESESLPNYENAMHVCTTANLFLLKAGLGEKTYYKFVKKILNDHPELAHGFPLTDFIFTFVNDLSKHPDYRPVTNDEETKSVTNKF